MTRILNTAHGPLYFPAFLPVTTFGGKFPLDELIRPYLIRSCSALMVSYHYAKAMTVRPKGILFIDSGGFASLFEGSAIAVGPDFASILTKDGSIISPEEVLRFQQQHGDIGATVDFVIPPNCPVEEAETRQTATLRNAIWAVQHRRHHGNFLLYASVQAWDATSARRVMTQLVTHSFDGFALGGMIPRIRSPETIFEIVRAIRSVETTRPLHVFGIGTPAIVRQLFAMGVDSVDSSNYVRAAVDGIRLDLTPARPMDSLTAMSSANCGCGACHLGSRYLELDGEANRMALALHNLHTMRQLGHTPEAVRLEA